MSDVPFSGAFPVFSPTIALERWKNAENTCEEGCKMLAVSAAVCKLAGMRVAASGLPARPFHLTDRGSVWFTWPCCSRFKP
jgi:hypothetical protein